MDDRHHAPDDTDPDSSGLAYVEDDRAVAEEERQSEDETEQAVRE